MLALRLSRSCSVNMWTRREKRGHIKLLKLLVFLLHPFSCSDIWCCSCRVREQLYLQSECFITPEAERPFPPESDSSLQCFCVFFCECEQEEKMNQSRERQTNHSLQKEPFNTQKSWCFQADCLLTEAEVQSGALCDRRGGAGTGDRTGGDAAMPQRLARWS